MNPCLDCYWKKPSSATKSDTRQVCQCPDAPDFTRPVDESDPNKKCVYAESVQAHDFRNMTPFEYAQKYYN